MQSAGECRHTDLANLGPVHNVNGILRDAVRCRDCGLYWNVMRQPENETGPKDIIQRAGFDQLIGWRG